MVFLLVHVLDAIRRIAEKLIVLDLALVIGGMDFQHGLDLLGEQSQPQLTALQLGGKGEK